MITPNSNPTVPISATGDRLEGWSSCCGAAVTYADYGALCCKACWREVYVHSLIGEQGRRLDEIVRAVLKGDMTCDAGVASQRDLVGYPTPAAAAVGARPR